MNVGVRTWAWLVVGVVWWRPCLAHSTYDYPYREILKAPYPHQETNDGDYWESKGAKEGEPTHHLALEVVGGEEQARGLASTHHLHYVRQVFTHPPVYHLHQPEEVLSSRRRWRAADLQHLVHLLAQEPGVRWVEQQMSFVRDKRRVPRNYQYDLRPGPLPNRGRLPDNHHISTVGSGFRNWTDHPLDASLTFNDPFYKDQWYLHNKGQLGRVGYDLNVTWAWLRGFTGRGVVLSILDDGIQTTNADIADHYEAEVSYSVVRDGRPLDDPSPRLDPSFSNHHGTYCAAVVAAVPNNSICGVGVAFEARVGGVRIVDGTVTDVQEATALSRHVDKVDVFSASWGPTDDGKKVEGPGKLAERAFLEGITKGREGKGVVYVWASGNGGIMGDNCNLDGYTSSIYTLSVSALTDTGSSTFYEEPCASTMGAVYVGGEHLLQDAMQRYKGHLRNLALVVPELDGQCSSSFQGTSAAAPLMAGVVALVLHANPNLTWRDVQHLLVETATPTTQALQEEGWSTNGHGRLFHLLQGFGAIDAGKMVEAALKWKNVKPQKIFNSTVFHGYRPLHPYEWLNKTYTLDLSDVPLNATITIVEHVIATISLTHRKRNLLTIFIVSPSGTTSQVLTHRPLDTSKAGFKSWKFMSVHFWGEQPQGTWTLAIKDSSGMKGYLEKITLTVYGF